MAETTKTILEQIGDFLGRKFNQIKAYVDEKVGDLSSYFKYDTKTGIVPSSAEDYYSELKPIPIVAYTFRLLFG